MQVNESLVLSRDSAKRSKNMTGPQMPFQTTARRLAATLLILGAFHSQGAAATFTIEPVGVTDYKSIYGEVRSRKVRTRMSAHEGDLLSTLALSRQLGECPETVVLYGIQPLRVEPGEGLTPRLERRLPVYARRVAESLNKLSAAVGT